MKDSAEQHRVMNCLSSKEQENWMNDYVETETTRTRQQVEDAETAITKEQEDTEMAGKTGLPTRKHKSTFHKVFVPIGDSLCDIARSGNGHDEEGQHDQETVQGKCSEGDKRGWVMGGICKKVQQRIVEFWKK